MARQSSDSDMSQSVTRDDLVALLNDDLAREYQAIISYVVYSQAIKGAQYMNIAAELEIHAAEELAHALTIAGRLVPSRLIMGTGGMTSPESLRSALVASRVARTELMMPPPRFMISM